MPLADRIRPSTLDEVVGQRHILAQGKPLYNIISRGKIPNMIFYGPSGVGKTTVANIIAQKTSMSLYRLNGTQASTSDIKDVVANLGTFGAAGGILLFLDEIQYLNKKQQQTLLERTAWLLLHHLMYCLWTHTDMMRDLQTRSCFISMRQWLPRMQICPLVLVWQKAGRPLRMV